VHHRPLALVSVLAGGDYLLWNWSLQGSHDVLGLVAGLTLPPLAIALVWLLGLNAARLLARAARTPRQQSRKAQMPRQMEQQHLPQTGGDRQQPASSSSKLAA
jgi:hypothetical protein